MSIQTELRHILPDFTVEVLAHVDRLPLSEALEGLVRQQWQAGCEANPHLYDGRVFHIDHFELPGRVFGRLLPYRYVYAQLTQPALRVALNLSPLGVQGIVTDASGRMLMGRRTRYVTQNPGGWEPVPAGSLDNTTLAPDGRLDWQHQLLKELKEETGITEVRHIEPLGLLAPMETGVWNVVARLHVQPDVAIEMAVAEYQQLAWLSGAEAALAHLGGLTLGQLAL